jgi:MFS family permease
VNEERSCPDAEAATRRVGGVPRWVVWTIFGMMGWLFMYADRAVLSPVLRAIGADFHVGPAALGLIPTSFFLAYTVLQIPVGWWADRTHPGYLLVAGFLGFGLFTALSGAVSAYPALLATQVLAGATQATYYPTQYAITTRLVPLRWRTVGTSLVNAGQGIGIAVGFALAGRLAQTAGSWRLPFVLLGVLTVLAGLALWWPAVRWVARPAAGAVPRRAGQLDVRRVGPLFAVNFTSLFGFFFMLSWFPYYLESQLGVDPGTAGRDSALMPLVSVPAAIAFARWADRRGQRRRLLRGLLGAAAVSLALVPLFGRTAALAAVLAGVYGVVGKLTADPLVAAEAAAASPPEHYGWLFGWLNFSGMAASVVAPLVAGLLAAATGTLAAGFWLSAALLGVGASVLSWHDRRAEEAQTGGLAG